MEKKHCFGLIKCPHCENRYTKYEYLRNHIDGFHKGIRSYKCLECNVAFVWKVTLKTHMKGVHPKNFDQWMKDNY